MGLETESGKSFDPGGGGTCAGGAGSGLEEGDQVIGTGGWRDNLAAMGPERYLSW